MKTGIAHAKEMHDLLRMLNIFSAIKITKLKLRPENYKMKEEAVEDGEEM